jgi:hypothetical protein
MDDSWFNVTLEPNKKEMVKREETIIDKKQNATPSINKQEKKEKEIVVQKTTEKKTTPPLVKQESSSAIDQKVALEFARLVELEKDEPMLKEDIDRYLHLPIKYPKIDELCEQHRKAIWFTQEVKDLSRALIQCPKEPRF